MANADRIAATSVVEARCWAIVPAAGVGSRMRSDRPKQYLSVQGRSVLERSVRNLLAEPRIESVVVALAENDPYWALTGLAAEPRVRRVGGGAERCHSVLNALLHLQGLAEHDDWILVHDAARPCLQPEVLRRLIDTLFDDPIGGLLALPVSDTIKRDDGAGRVATTLDRNHLWRAQTPQMFRYGLLLPALSAAIEAGVLVTDDCAAMERAGHQPRLVEGSAGNLKVTHAEDLALAEFYCRSPAIQDKLIQAAMGSVDVD